MFKIFKRVFRHLDKFDVDMDELNIKKDNGAKIVDVRSPQEYEEGHIDGAINIPLYEINNKFDEIINDKNQEIVLYCLSGQRSKDAYKKVVKLGYSNVFNLHGGLENWK